MKKKQIAIMQPTYMPWMGYFSMIDKVDEFVFLDNVQLSGRSWQVRNKIKLNNEEKMLTIPIEKKLHRDKRLINNTKYYEEKWKRSHLDCIKMAYNKAPYYEKVMCFLERHYEKPYESVGDFTISLIKEIMMEIGIETPIYRASDLDNVDGKKDDLLVGICKCRGATSYLSAQGSAQYIEKNTPGGAFVKECVQLKYQNYVHPEYKQLGGTFISHIGVYDLLFCVGFENALGLIREGNREDIDYLLFREKYM